jgi:hypothetical protein
MNRIDVTPLEIKDFAISHGWALVKDALKDGLYVLNSPGEDGTQIVLPKNDTDSKFDELAFNSIKWLSMFLEKPKNKVIEEIREVNDDVIGLRYHSESKKVNSISFEEALDAIESTRQLILSAASSVISPKLYHPKLIRTEPLELIKKTRFRHTEEGSFILKVSCPIELETNPNGYLFDDGPNYVSPLSRKSFEIINNSAIKIINSIEGDSLEKLFEEEARSEKPQISYNLCDAITNIFDEERELPFELMFNWSRANLTKIPTPQVPNRIQFPFEYKQRIDYLKNFFKPQPKEITDTFIGTVEELQGDEGDNNKRSGYVILSLLIETEIVKARADLNPEDYDLAIKAHKEVGTYVMIEGKLRPGKRIKPLENIKSFKIVEKKIDRK